MLGRPAGFLGGKNRASEGVDPDGETPLGVKSFPQRGKVAPGVPRKPGAG